MLGVVSTIELFVNLLATLLIVPLYDILQNKSIQPAIFNLDMGSPIVSLSRQAKQLPEALLFQKKKFGKCLP